MTTRKVIAKTTLLAMGCIALGLLGTPAALAHCDTMDGPVVMDAKTALEKSDVTGVLKWVSKDNEDAIRTAFQKTLAVRAKGPEAKDLADMYFFETLVRIHRAGEGAPYTGIKPAGSEVEPAIVAADKSLDGGSPDALVKVITDLVAQGIRQQHAQTAEAKKHAVESVEAGRKYVAAYVTFIHYVERLHLDATAAPAHHGEATASPAGNAPAEHIEAVPAAAPGHAH